MRVLRLPALLQTGLSSKDRACPPQGSHAPQSAAAGTGLPLYGKYPTTAVVLLPETPRHQAPIGPARHIGPPCTERCMPTGQWGDLSFRVPARADCTSRHGASAHTNPKEQRSVALRTLFCQLNLTIPALPPPAHPLPHARHSDAPPPLVLLLLLFVMPGTHPQCGRYV